MDRGSCPPRNRWPTNLPAHPSASSPACLPTSCLAPSPATLAQTSSAWGGGGATWIPPSAARAGRRRRMSSCGSCLQNMVSGVGCKGGGARCPGTIELLLRTACPSLCFLSPACAPFKTCDLSWLASFAVCCWGGRCALHLTPRLACCPVTPACPRRLLLELHQQEHERAHRAAVPRTLVPAVQRGGGHNRRLPACLFRWRLVPLLPPWPCQPPLLAHPTVLLAVPALLRPACSAQAAPMPPAARAAARPRGRRAASRNQSRSTLGGSQPPTRAEL